MTKEKKLKLLSRKLKKKTNFYCKSLNQRCEQLHQVPGFEPTILSEFAAGYMAALGNVRAWGLHRVEENAVTGIPK